MTSSPVRASPEKVAAAAAEATGILSAPLQLTGADPTVEISVAAIAGAMTITPDGADGFVVGVDVPAAPRPVHRGRRGHPDLARRRDDRHR